MRSMKRSKHILWIIHFLVFSLLLSSCGKAEETGGKNKEIHIGYQKNGTTLLLKHKQELQKELEKEGYKVTWSEFNTGSSILEALNAGSIDFAGAGDIPSIFALEKGSNFNYIASEPSSPSSEGILVRKDSGIQSLEDLKGKRIAFNKASIAQYLLTKALDSAGLSMDDVEPVYLNPPEASIAFEQGEVDAWVVWDPYMTVAESKGHIILKDATGIVPYRTFYFSTPEITKEHPEIVKKFVEHLSNIGKQINHDPTEAAALLQKATNIPAETWEKVLNNKKSDVHFMDEKAVRDLQTEADDLLKIGLIKKQVQIEDYVWYPEK
ncbi:aliphatic sulfonate ABC transporter substrate-binding protein [Parageobacillus thermoglucosidasius]|uniref:aliphatic sulfonate ABC transporter substrate-binding protein n=1 Tax=Parageobacillus thermoglucosidasius TaxID=1426 RepID=UPI003B68469B